MLKVARCGDSFLGVNSNVKVLDFIISARSLFSPGWPPTGPKKWSLGNHIHFCGTSGASSKAVFTLPFTDDGTSTTSAGRYPHPNRTLAVFCSLSDGLCLAAFSAN